MCRRSEEGKRRSRYILGPLSAPSHGRSRREPHRPLYSPRGPATSHPAQISSASSSLSLSQTHILIATILTATTRLPPTAHSRGRVNTVDRARKVFNTAPRQSNRGHAKLGNTIYTPISTAIAQSALLSIRRRNHPCAHPPPSDRRRHPFSSAFPRFKRFTRSPSPLSTSLPTTPTHSRNAGRRVHSVSHCGHAHHWSVGHLLRVPPRNHTRPPLSHNQTMLLHLMNNKHLLTPYSYQDAATVYGLNGRTCNV